MDVSDRTRESLIAVFEAHEALIDRLISENAKLRDAVNYLYGFAKTLGVDEGDMREFGIEVDDEQY